MFSPLLFVFPFLSGELFPSFVSPDCNAIAADADETVEAEIEEDDSVENTAVDSDLEFDPSLERNPVPKGISTTNSLSEKYTT